MLGNLTAGSSAGTLPSVPRLSPLAGFAARRRHVRGSRFYRQFIPQGGLCFDVGANMGDRTAIFLGLGARVIAVEPQPACAETLRQRFDDRVAVVDAALGPAPGQASLMIASYHTLASLSRDWVEAVRESGRFADFTWEREIATRMTTLDELIGSYGVPDFCKLDVEGFELEVLEGLSRPVRALSFEFTFERLGTRLAAGEYVARLGMRRFNFSYGESLTLALKEWIGPAEMLHFLESTPKSIEIFGDVYARS